MISVNSILVMDKGKKHHLMALLVKPVKLPFATRPGLLRNTRATTAHTKKPPAICHSMPLLWTYHL